MTRSASDFSSAIRDHLKRFRKFSFRHTYERNRLIYRMDDPADSVYVLESGWVKVEIISPEGKGKIIAICQPGGLFGELCMCGVVRRLDQAVALEPATALSFDVHAVMKLLTRDAETARSFLRLMCGRVLECQDQVTALAFDPVRRRLARELLRLSQLPGSRTEGAAVRLGVYLTHEELAALIGTSRGMITQVMNQFRQQGLVDYARREISVVSRRLTDYLAGC